MTVLYTNFLDFDWRKSILIGTDGKMIKYVTKVEMYEPESHKKVGTLEVMKPFENNLASEHWDKPEIEYANNSLLFKGRPLDFVVTKHKEGKDGGVMIDRTKDEIPSETVTFFNAFILPELPEWAKEA
jgi:hypothetical protein